MSKIQAAFNWGVRKGLIIGLTALSVAINGSVSILSTVNMVLIGGWASKIHAKLFDVDATGIRQSYFGFLANYKIVVIGFVVVPWIALNLMGGS